MADEATLRIVLDSEDESILREPAAGTAPDKEDSRLKAAKPTREGKEDTEIPKTLWQRLGEDIIGNAADVVFSNLSGPLGSRIAGTFTSSLLDNILRGTAKPPSSSNSTTPASDAATGDPTQTPAAPVASNSAPSAAGAGAATEAATGHTTAAGEAAGASEAAAGAASAAAPAVGAAVGALGGPAGIVVGIAAAVIVGDKILQTVVQLAGYLYRTMNQMVENTKNFSPEVAQEVAAAELRQINMELRRARDIGPALARYEKALSVISTGMEDIKTFMISFTAWMIDNKLVMALLNFHTGGALNLAKQIYNLYEKWLDTQLDMQLKEGMDFLDKPLKPVGKAAAPVMPEGIF